MIVTMKKIAEIANVSRATVDKVLNNRQGVSDSVRRKVQEIADALDYKPNIIGKALSTHNNPIIIGVIIPPEENPFYEEIKRGISVAYAELKDFGIVVECHAMKSLDEQEQLSNIKHLRNKGIMALALAAIDHEVIRAEIDDLVSSNIPVVTFNSDITESKRMCFIGHDLVRSGRVAGSLMGMILSKKGKVAIITGSHHILAHKQRILI